MPGFDTDSVGGGGVLYATNVDFTGTSFTSGTRQVTTNGQLLIGSTATPNIKVGTLTSPGGTVTIGYSSPNITIDVAGGMAAVEHLTGNSGGQLNPTLNNFNILGASTAAGTSPVTTVGAVSTITVNVQTSQALAAADATKIGLCNFDSASFAVAATGFVTASGTGLAKTITGDSGGALSPTAGNWNILGLSGSKTSGSGSTLTVKSPPYADQGGSTTVTLNSGSFATAAITLTTPVTAGLADGDLLEFVATNGVLVIQLAATQVAHLGVATTTVAGTITGTATGDSIILRYQVSTNDWWATSAVGTWMLA